MDVKKDPRYPFRKAACVTETEIVERESMATKSWHDGPVYPELPNWQTKSPIEKSKMRVVKDLLLNFCFLLFPISYIALGALIFGLNGHPIASGSPGILANLGSTALYYGLEQSITISVTLFPILFGIVLCKTLKTAVQYKAERGTTILTLEQLMASKSFGSAALGPLNFKKINTIGISLLLLWLMSPLTTQSLQRMFSYDLRTMETEHKDVWYLNTLNSQAIFPVLLPSTPHSAALLQSEFLQPERDSPVDIYGNPRIPLLNEVQSACTGVGGFLSEKDVSLFGPEVSICNTSVQLNYSSSLGLPIAGLLGNASTYSTVTRLKATSSYWTVSCSPWTQLRSSEVFDKYHQSAHYDVWNRNTLLTNCRLPDGSACPLHVPDTTYFFYVDTISKPRHPKIVFGAKTQETGLFGLKTPERGLFETTTCDLKNQQVDATIGCAGKSCAVVAIEQSSSPVYNSSFVESLSVVLGYMTGVFPGINTGLDTHVFASSFYEKWLYDPSAVFDFNNTESYVNISTVPMQTFEQRFGASLTTAYKSYLDPISFTMGLPFRFPSKDLNWYNKTTATVSKLQLAYKANVAWLVALMISCLVVIIVVCANAYMQTRVLGPEVLGYVSSMTQNNPFIPLPGGGSNLDGMERTLMLANLKVRLHDVQPNQDTGHIALATVAGRPLEKGRVYT